MYRLLFLPPLCLSSLLEPPHSPSSDLYAVFCSLELSSQTQKTDTEARSSRKHSQEYFLGLRFMEHRGPHRELSEEGHKFEFTYRDHVAKKRKGEKEKGYSHRSVWIYEFGNFPLSADSQPLGEACEKASSPGEDIGSYFWLWQESTGWEDGDSDPLNETSPRFSLDLPRHSPCRWFSKRRSALHLVMVLHTPGAPGSVPTHSLSPSAFRWMWKHGHCAIQRFSLSLQGWRDPNLKHKHRSPYEERTRSWVPLLPVWSKRNKPKWLWFSLRQLVIVTVLPENTYRVCLSCLYTEHACLLAAPLHIRIVIILGVISKVVQVLSGYCSSCTPSQCIPCLQRVYLPSAPPLPLLAWHLLVLISNSKVWVSA